jgi:hypothetical protein
VHVRWADPTLSPRKCISLWYCSIQMHLEKRCFLELVQHADESEHRIRPTNMHSSSARSAVRPCCNRPTLSIALSVARYASQLALLACDILLWALTRHAFRHGTGRALDGREQELLKRYCKQSGRYIASIISCIDSARLDVTQVLSRTSTATYHTPFSRGGGRSSSRSGSRCDW